MNQLSTLLVVDPDPGGLKTLTYGFEREGCTVAGTSDPSLAPDLVRTTSPQLAVVSLRGPGRLGMQIISDLRGGNGSNGRRLPVVTLGPADLKPEALAAGASDFLPTPLFVRDVISVGKLLTLREQAPAAGSSDAGIEIQGLLSEYYGLFYLLRAMAVTGRSAVLLMNRGNRKAELRFCDGAVVSVHVGSLQGLPALHSILLWDEAALSIKFRDVPRTAQIPLSADELLEECERFLRDFAFNARDLGAPRTVYLASPDGASAAGLQPGQVGPVLRLFDGHRVLAEVIEESPFRVFDTLRVIKRLIDAGTLRVKAETAPPDRPGPRSMMEQWVGASDLRAHGAAGGDRGRSNRRPRPVANPAPAPIPLTVKKSAASGEFAVRMAPARPRALSGELANAPTVQVQLDGAGIPVAIPMMPVQPAPLTAREPTVVVPAMGGEPTPPPARSVGPDPIAAPPVAPPPIIAPYPPASSTEGVPAPIARPVDASLAPIGPDPVSLAPPVLVLPRPIVVEPVAAPEPVMAPPPAAIAAPAPEPVAAPEPVVAPPLAVAETPPPAVALDAAAPAIALDAPVPPPQPPVEAPEPAAVALEPVAAPAQAAPAPAPVAVAGEIAAAPAPQPAAAQPSARTRTDSKPRLKKVNGPARLSPTEAFDDLEADFFAREADLYKQEAVESFDDLDGAPPGDSPAGTKGTTKKR